ncbi:MAG: hypothetical protein WCO68_07220 [Verrucomicrobiota bacterium]
MNFPRQTTGGFSLIDVALASAILAFGLAGIYDLFLFGVHTLRAADDSAIANKNLVQRLDQVQRTPVWTNVTSPSYLGTLLATPITATTQNLSGLTQESITLSAVALPYASPTPSSTPSPTPTPAPFTVTRSGNTVVISPASAPSLAAAAAVTIKLNIQWQDRSGRSHTRELSTILSNAGTTR